MINETFYAELGKLLYAMAYVDGLISPAEKRKLQDIVKNELTLSESHIDQYGTNVAYYTEIEFDFLDEEMADSEAAFDSFINFMETHHTAFDDSLKTVCLHVINQLASVYKGINSKEKQLLNKLKKSFELVLI